KKIKKLTIGANIESIGAKAFSGAKKLKTITVKSTKLTAAKCKKCLSGSSVNTVTVPKAVKKMYTKKIFIKKVCGKKVKVK
ncbi:leucine-rich repeat protein, partial [Vibrio sp. FNV 38]|nr:leucine-rich repeat protein [Vibrio sp. FNV 38]